MNKLIAFTSVAALSVAVTSAAFAGGPVIVAEEIEPAVETPGERRFSGGVLPIILGLIVVGALVAGNSSSSSSTAPPPS